jgi:hypothetical protein
MLQLIMVKLSGLPAVDPTGASCRVESASEMTVIESLVVDPWIDRATLTGGVTQP